MQIHKFNYDELPENFHKAIENLKLGRDKEREAKRLCDGAKGYFKQFLKESRQLDFDKLEIGDGVLLNYKTKEGFVCALKIEIGEQKKFDQSTFLLENGELYAKYVKPNKVVNYKV